MINPIYSPAPERYDNGMKFRRCGQSGILLPEISLGLWHNFGDVNTFANSQAMAHYAFDRGITHFDLANNYGPSYGSAEETFGMIMKKSFMPYRDELFISTKAGHDMWPGPYGFGLLQDTFFSRPLRGVGLTQVPDEQPQPKSETDEPGVCGHLLLPPLRPGYSA